MNTEIDVDEEMIQIKNEIVDTIKKAKNFDKLNSQYKRRNPLFEKFV